MSGTGPDVVHLVLGPPEHGVVRYAQELARLTGGRVVHVAGPGEVPELSADLVHLHYTDRLWAPYAEDSASAFARMAARIGPPLSVTLHDVPPGDGSTLHRRRAAAYAVVLAAATGVVVNSEHERTRLTAVPTPEEDRPPVAVVPLPVDATVLAPADRPDPDGQVVVLGFLYPGKGYEETLAALSGLPATVGLTALGRPSQGHAGLVEDLSDAAAAAGRQVRVTGFVPDEELPARLRAAAVPVAPHRAVSASGSIASWLAAGRRPLVPDVAYNREVQARGPGSLWLYDNLAAALAQAYADPGSTWLDPGTATGPTGAEVARAYRDLWSTWC